MRVFIEKQRFNQTWLYILLFVIFTVLLYHYINIIISDTAAGIYAFSIAMLVFLVVAYILLFSQLKTRIDSKGIEVYFHPFPFTRKKYTWNEIKSAFVREYSPISEFGGWGIRGLGKNKAYNTSGRFGIQIVTNAGKRFLIGTQHPEKVKKVLNNIIHHQL